MKNILYPFKYQILPTINNGYLFNINPYTGDLIKSLKNLRISVIDEKLRKNLEHCNNPYLCNNVENDYSISLDKLNKLNAYHKKLLELSNNRFFQSLWYSRFQRGLFKNSEEACTHINQIELQKELHYKLCLQRSLLIAKTSITFKKTGTLFIGAQLPTNSMHAWIIDNGNQPDKKDRIWINYKPLLALYY